MLQLGSIQLPGPAIQAALSGYSDLPMRQVARAHGAPFCLNEVVLNEHVVTKGRLTKLLFDIPSNEHPVGAQLMGSQPKDFGPAARALVAAGYDLVDINFGCPVPRVLGRCRGGYLLGQTETALAIVDQVLQAVAGDAPVTIKMRRGIDADQESESNFFAILEGAFDRGIAAVTVHGRTVLQRYKGPSDWGFLREVKARMGNRPVLGSGDLFGPYDVQRMLRETLVDGVTLARGAIGNPFLFGQVQQVLAGQRPKAPSVAEQRAAIEMHWQAAAAHYPAKKVASKLRMHAVKYASLHPEPIAVRDDFVRARGEAELGAVLARWYGPERAMERSEGLISQDLSAQGLKSCGVAGGVVPGSSTRASRTVLR